MIRKVFKVIVQLYASFRTGLRSGRVVSTGSLKIDDLVALAVSRRADLNPDTLKAGYMILRSLALEQILEGKYVEFGLSHYGLLVGGLFEGDNPDWNDEINSLYLRAATSADVRNALLSVEKELRGAANVGIAINRLIDKESGLINRRITPGGGVVIEGYRLKIAGDAAGVGLFLKNIETGQVTQIPETSIIKNNPAVVSFVVPAHLPEGEYQLSIVSQFSKGSKKLKVPLAYVFAVPLKCNRGKAGINKQESPAG